MDSISVAIVASGLLAYALLSGRLINTIVTAPIVFVAFGWIVGPGGLDVAHIDPGHGAIHTIAELTLVLILFTDAARIDLSCLRSDHNLPLRMLVFGLPMIVALGTLAATWLLPSLPVWEAALLAALLAPTDAALAQPVLTAKSVPVRIRQALNVESGLNDGLALPAVLIFAALASAGQAPTGEWLRFGLLQVTLGPLVGIAAGFLGGRALDLAAERGWASTPFQGIGILSLAVLAYVAAELVGGNGFIAAFVAGLVFGSAIRHRCAFLFEFMETEGQLLMAITFLVFGAALLPQSLEHVNLSVVFYALLSLTVIRIVPVLIALLGSGVRWQTRLFLGWFGPRGIASILFALLILEDAVGDRHEIVAVTMITVGLSVLAHGVTAAPLAALYGRLTAAMQPSAEHRSVAEMPLRHGHFGDD